MSTSLYGRALQHHVGGDERGKQPGSGARAAGAWYAGRPGMIVDGKRRSACDGHGGPSPSSGMTIGPCEHSTNTPNVGSMVKGRSGRRKWSILVEMIMRDTKESMAHGVWGVCRTENCGTSLHGIIGQDQAQAKNYRTA